MPANIEHAVRKYVPRPQPEAEGGDAARPRVPVEIGGRTEGREPTRYGDWEKQGRCIDF